MRDLVRPLALLGVGACVSTLPEAATSRDAVTAGSNARTANEDDDVGSEAGPGVAMPTVRAPALDAEALLAAAGLATYLEDHGLRAAEIDGAAMERWFTREPGAVFLYAERPLALSESASVSGRCQRVARVDDGVLNEIAFVISRRAGERVLLAVGQESVDVVEQRLERGRWETNGVRRLPSGVIAWNDAQVAYAEGAERQEVACVPTLRAVPCSEGPGVTPRGHCVDQALVVRPWRAPTVPHVGAVVPAYRDEIPTVPLGACTVVCEPSACGEALERAHIPRVPLHGEGDPVLAVFRAQAACRAFAATRTSQRPSGTAW